MSVEVMYRKKPVLVSAEQWLPGKAVAGVIEHAPQIRFSRDRRYFYLDCFPKDGPRPDAWLAVVPGIGPNMDVLPFAFWDVKSGDTQPARKGEELTDRYLAHMKLEELPAAYGIIETLEGRMTCDAGDWIITGVKGEKYPCKREIFEQTYERVEIHDAEVTR